MGNELENPIHQCTVGPEAAGRRLDVFLSESGIGLVRRRAKELILAGHVEVDGRRGKPGQSLESGQVVSVRLVPETDVARAGPDPASWGFELRVIYEDADLVVVDKPAGIAVHRPDHPAAAIPNLADLAVATCGPLSLVAGDDRPGIVHRLDRDTTGVMVLARTDEAMHFLKAQFKAREVAKEYRALVFGVPRFQSDWIERPIAPHPKQGDKMTVVQEGGKEAATYYELVERFDGFSHLLCRPRTGRTHQIRVHLTSVGHSLIDDRVYVSRNQQQRSLPDGCPAPGRQCLHARRLEFTHPRSRERMSFDAPLPEDMEAVLRWMREHRPG